MIDSPLAFKILFVALVLLVAAFVAKILTENRKAEETTDADSKPIYADRDVLGQSKSWLDSDYFLFKDDVPSNSKPTIAIILAVAIMILILFVVGL